MNGSPKVDRNLYLKMYQIVILFLISVFNLIIKRFRVEYNEKIYETNIFED